MKAFVGRLVEERRACRRDDLEELFHRVQGSADAREGLAANAGGVPPSSGASRGPTRDVVSGRIGGERVAFGEFGERHAAAGKSRRGKTQGPGQSASPRCGPVVSSDALALRQVCRAGFAGRGTACEL